MHAPHQLVLTKRLAAYFSPEASFPSLRSSRTSVGGSAKHRSLRRPLQRSATLTQDRPMPPTAKPPVFFPNTMFDGQGTSKEPAELVEPFCQATYGALQIIEKGMHSGEGIQGCSIYTGTGGIAYMFLRLAENLQHTEPVIAQHPRSACAKLSKECLLIRAQEYGHWAKHLSHCSSRKKRVSFLEGHPGCLALQTAIASLMNNQVQAQHSLQELESWGPTVLQMPSTECEVLYGRCGFLHALLFARKYVGPSPGSSQLIKQLVQQIVEEGRRGAQELRGMDPSSNWELMWSWHGSYYLGGAHGVCGILLTLMQCYSELEELYPGQAASLVMGGVGGLLSQTLPSGNLLSSLGSENDKYVQWCHGAPSLIPVLTKAYELLDDSTPQTAEAKEQFLVAAKKAADVVWERGLLIKGLGLCHGISGNAYAFLSLYRVTKDERCKSRAQQFAQFMVDHCKELKDVPDAPLSLYEGLGGAVCLWMDMLSPEIAAPFPGYEL